MNGQQLKALECTIAAGAGVLTDKHAALLALCRELARLMDGHGTDVEPSTRVIAAYLSALKDLGRALAAPEDRSSVGGKLSELRAQSGLVPVRGRERAVKKVVGREGRQGQRAGLLAEVALE